MAKNRDIAEEDLMEAMIKVMNDPSTPAEREFAERVGRTLTTMYHHYDDTKSTHEIDETDRAQIESALELFAHLRSKEHAGDGPREWHARRRKFLKLRDQKIRNYARTLIAKRRTDVLDKLVERYGPGSDPDDDDSDNIVPHFPLGHGRLSKLLSEARRKPELEPEDGGYGAEVKNRAAP
jgi:hypothetical protein